MSAHNAPGITGCNYGVHAFGFLRTFGDSHLHECSRCGATYFGRGPGECYECVTSPGSGAVS